MDLVPSDIRLITIGAVVVVLIAVVAWEYARRCAATPHKEIRLRVIPLGERAWAQGGRLTRNWAPRLPRKREGANLRSRVLSAIQRAQS